MSDATIAEAEIRRAKAALRREALQVRSQIPAGNRAGEAVKVAGRVCELLRRRGSGGVVSGFLPIGDELDPRPAMEAARADGARICLPVMSGRDRPLQFRLWSPGDAMVERQWGILEPSEEAEAVEPDVLLMPLLAFDERGGRLGYGGGYYDRTLARLRGLKPVLAVGLAYDVQRVDSVPCLDYDGRLDWVLTPTRSIDCRLNG
jgi:5-formyltetrahydrofolate cyclo-ligase